MSSRATPWRPLRRGSPANANDPAASYKARVRRDRGQGETHAVSSRGFHRLPGDWARLGFGALPALLPALSSSTLAMPARRSKGEVRRARPWPLSMRAITHSRVRKPLRHPNTPGSQEYAAKRAQPRDSTQLQTISTSQIGSALSPRYSQTGTLTALQINGPGLDITGNSMLDIKALELLTERTGLSVFQSTTGFSRPGAHPDRQANRPRPSGDRTGTPGIPSNRRPPGAGAGPASRRLRQ